MKIIMIGIMCILGILHASHAKHFQKCETDSNACNFIDHKNMEYSNKACELGDGVACGLIAKMYHEGKSVKRDLNKAYRYYKKACDLNHALSCNMAGFLVNPKDDKKTYEFFKKACDLNHGEACSSVGFFHTHGKGVEKNHTIALKAYSTGCALGAGIACVGAGSLSEESLKHDTALEYYQKGCELNNAKACHETAHIKQKISKGEHEALEYYKKACHLGYSIACKKVGDELDSKQALEYYKKACKFRDAIACKKAGDLQRDIKQSANALESYQQACNLGHGEACYLAGKLSQTRKKAIEFFKKACEFNIQNGCDHAFEVE